MQYIEYRTDRLGSAEKLISQADRHTSCGFCRGITVAGLRYRHRCYARAVSNIASQMLASSPTAKLPISIVYHVIKALSVLILDAKLGIYHSSQAKQIGYRAMHYRTLLASRLPNTPGIRRKVSNRI